MHRRIRREDRGRATKRIDTLTKWNFRAPNGEPLVIVQHRDHVIVTGDQRRRHKELKLSRRPVEQRGEMRIGIRPKVRIEGVKVEIWLSHRILRDLGNLIVMKPTVGFMLPWAGVTLHPVLRSCSLSGR